MFFGAGNVIFPLAVGQIAGTDTWPTIFGLLLTAVVVPFAGVFAMILYKGDTRAFFAKLGKWPGFLLGLLIILLLGPFGSAPRCIALMHSTINTLVPVSQWNFNALTAVLIFVLSFQKKRLMEVLGLVLTPLLLVSLGIIIFMGLFSRPEIIALPSSGWDLFFFGLKEGYYTMDLLAAFFFSATVFHVIAEKKNLFHTINTTRRLTIAAGLIGAILLAVVYIAFSWIAAFHASDVIIQKELLLHTVAYRIAGPIGSWLVALTVVLACLTTAIALLAACSDFLQTAVFERKVSYHWILLGCTVITFFISMMQFSGIEAFLGPILQIAYPGLIALTMWSIIDYFYPKRINPYWVWLVFMASAASYWFL